MKDENNNTIAALCSGEAEILSMGECLHIDSSSQGIEWVFDGGASFHATSNWEFYSYREGDFSTVKMENDSSSKVLRIGDIYLETNVSCKLVLKDVIHVLELRLNPISVCVIDRQGYEHYIGYED